MPQRIRGVIFDCDGTLVDSESLSLGVLAEYAAEFGADVGDGLLDFAGENLRDAFTHIRQRMEVPLPANHIEVFRQRQFEALSARLKPMPGAEQLLRDCRLPFCVASNAPRSKVHLCLEVTGLLQYIDESRILSAYELKAWKPDPTIFLESAQRLGVIPEECAVVEDSLPGRSGKRISFQSPSRRAATGELPAQPSCRGEVSGSDGCHESRNRRSLHCQKTEVPPSADDRLPSPSIPLA